MTRTEIIQVLGVIASAYPNMKEMPDSIVEVWYRFFQDFDKKLVETAALKTILKSPYPPSIADIMKQIEEILAPPEDRKDAAEAWGEVIKAIHHYGYYQEKKALESMSPRVAKVVKYMGWREICHSEEVGVIRGQFLKMYTAVTEREIQDRLIPLAIKKDIKQLSGDMGLKSLENGGIQSEN